MRLTRYTDYAFRTMMYLDTQRERLVPIHEIARIYDISENHLMKVVHRLGQHGFIKTTRGRRGGLRMNRPAKEIVLGHVVRCTEDDMAIANCMRQEGLATQCILSRHCALQHTLGRALEAFMNVLDGITLADIMSIPQQQTLQSAATQQGYGQKVVA